MSNQINRYPIRLGGPVTREFGGPEEWVNIHHSLGYTAAYSPVSADEPDDIIDLYEKTASNANLIIAEVGVWNNPISPEDDERKKAIDYCIKQLELAEKLGAKCCVNVSGSRNEEHWYGPHPNNLTEDTFDLIVEITRKIIDAVKPTRTFYTLEPMPWSYPDSIESYQKLIEAIDRDAFGVHFDPVNLINSPRKYFNNTQFIKDFFSAFGDKIKSIHAKDVVMSGELTTHIDEVRPGAGKLDYNTLLDLAATIPDLPFMMEHLKSEDEYKFAAEYIKNRAESNGFGIVPATKIPR